MSDHATLWALFFSSFLAATLLPGGSEVVLYAVLKTHPAHYWLALAVATAGNTLGGMSSWVSLAFIALGKLTRYWLIANIAA
jgi:membrane protein YqaA with SNARE-associated domain